MTTSPRKRIGTANWRFHSWDYRTQKEPYGNVDLPKRPEQRANCQVEGAKLLRLVFQSEAGQGKDLIYEYVRAEPAEPSRLLLELGS